MDWIERMIGIRPDGGSGALEAAIAFAIMAVLLLARVSRRHGERRAGQRGIQ
jgi:hypothetical protein